MCRSYWLPLSSVVIALASIASAALHADVAGFTQDGQGCPKVNIECPIDLVTEGTPATISVSVEGAADPEKLTYNWSISGSEIIEGQGTKAIKVKWRYNQMVTAAVKVCGLEDRCKNTASCSFNVQD